MSINGEMTTLADQVRRLSGETVRLGISDMATALSGVTVGGGVSLENVSVLIADYSDSATYTITEGAYYGTKRAIVTI